MRKTRSNKVGETGGLHALSRRKTAIHMLELLWGRGEGKVVRSKSAGGRKTPPHTKLFQKKKVRIITRKAYTREANTHLGF